MGIFGDDGRAVAREEEDATRDAWRYSGYRARLHGRASSPTPAPAEDSEDAPRSPRMSAQARRVMLTLRVERGERLSLAAIERWLGVSRPTAVADRNAVYRALGLPLPSESGGASSRGS